MISTYSVLAKEQKSAPLFLSRLIHCVHVRLVSLYVHILRSLYLMCMVSNPTELTLFLMFLALLEYFRVLRVSIKSLKGEPHAV